MSPDYCSRDHFELIKHGKCALSFLANTVNLIVYTEFESMIAIEANRNVLFDYIANVDRSEKPGSSWVAFYLTKSKRENFFIVMDHLRAIIKNN